MSEQPSATEAVEVGRAVFVLGVLLISLFALAYFATQILAGAVA